MEKWTEGRLIDYYDFSSGLSKSAKEFGFGDPFLSFKTVFNNYYIPDELYDLANTTEKEQEKCSIMEGDVFLTRTSETLDELGMSTVALKDYPKATFNGFTKRLRPKFKNSIYPKYAAYYFRSNYFRKNVTSFSSMTTRASLNNDMLGRLPIVIPPYEMQIRIGDMLYLLDQKIELNNKLNANLEELIHKLYVQWFVNFEFLNSNGNLYRQSGGKMKDSILGSIPADWDVLSLSDIMEYQGGSQPPAKEFIKEWRAGYERFVQIRDYDTDAHVTYIPIAKKNKLCGKLDILIARYGASLGRICMGLEGAYNVALAKVYPKKEIYHEFIRRLLKDDRFYKYINSSGDRSAQSGFNQGDIDGYKLAFPHDDSLLERFNKICEPVIVQILTLREENSKLNILRETLLPKLMAGDIELSKIDIDQL